ncbi:MAG: lamin tail domain-containing protein, partial [Planctomycetes bacterium]|nr:lamin tail domain-containing protein [Planctomycetota bacterium]
LIQGNTFYGNGYSIACFEKSPGVGGGQADAINNIFSQSKLDAILVDDLSILAVSYCLSDTDELDGPGNIHADPLLGHNLRLTAASPAMNTGSPASPADPDGSRSDMGAYAYRESNQAFVVISEIHYHPKNGEILEFIELTNTGDTTQDLSGWTLTRDIEYRFPSGRRKDGAEKLIFMPLPTPGTHNTDIGSDLKN